jgi:hypothetical protein
VKIHDYMETISRQEARLANRYRHAQNAWLQLLRSRELLADQCGAGPQPAEASQADPAGAEPASAPVASDPVPQPDLQNEANFAQAPVIATRPPANSPAPKPAQPDSPAQAPARSGGRMTIREYTYLFTEPPCHRRPSTHSHPHSFSARPASPDTT